MPQALEVKIEAEKAGITAILVGNPTRIALPGSVGLGGYTESSYSYDNFLRLDLSP